MREDHPLRILLYWPFSTIHMQTVRRPTALLLSISYDDPKLPVLAILYNFGTVLLDKLTRLITRIGHAGSIFDRNPRPVHIICSRSASLSPDQPEGITTFTNTQTRVHLNARIPSSTHLALRR